jgi:hypothetical protein
MSVVARISVIFKYLCTVWYQCKLLIQLLATPEVPVLPLEYVCSACHCRSTW